MRRLGVDIFFVISGYVVTGSLLRRSAGVPPDAGSYLASFYARRFSTASWAAWIVIQAS